LYISYSTVGLIKIFDLSTKLAHAVSLCPYKANLFSLTLDKYHRQRSQKQAQQQQQQPTATAVVDIDHSHYSDYDDGYTILTV
jgi:predicted metallo-beta-lactamase superfamily hydrolase